MKGILLVFNLLLFCSLRANAGNSYFSSLVDNEEPAVSPYQNMFQSKTKDALLSYNLIEERANYFVFKFKTLTFGEYTDQLLYAAPLVTGKVEFSISRINFYYNHFSNETGIKYKMKF